MQGTQRASMPPPARALRTTQQGVSACKAGDLRTSHPSEQLWGPHMASAAASAPPRALSPLCCMARPGFAASLVLCCVCGPPPPPPTACPAACHGVRPAVLAQG